MRYYGTMITLNDVITRNNNNYDIIRLIAALSVVFGHSFYLFHSYGHADPVTRFLLKDDYSGSIAVYLFFL